MSTLHPRSTRESAVVIIAILGLFLLIGLAGCIWLIANKAAGESIAIVAGLTGTALGQVGAMLNQTEKQQPATTIQSAEQVNSGGPTNLTPPSDPA